MIPEIVSAIEKVGIGAVAVGALIWFVVYKSRIDDSRNQAILNQAKQLNDEILKQSIKREEYLMSLNENHWNVLSKHSEQIREFQTLVKRGLDKQYDEHTQMVHALESIKLTMETLCTRIK